MNRNDYVLPDWAYKLKISDYPSIETAHALVAALAKKTAGSWAEIEAMTGIADAGIVAERCRMVYGLPQLDNAASELAQVWMKQQEAAASLRKLQAPSAVPEATKPRIFTDTFGFTPADHNTTNNITKGTTPK